MRLRVRNLIIALTAVGALTSAGAASASAASGPGTMYTVAGSGKYAISTSGTQPQQSVFGALAGVAVDAAGDVAVSDGTRFGGGRNAIDLIPASDCASNCALGLSDLHRGLIQAVVGIGATNVPTTGEPVGKASLAVPQALSFDAAGDLAITENLSGQVDLLANHNCSSGCPYGLSTLRKGYIYRVAGGGSGSYASGAVATSVSLAAPYEPTFDSGQDLIFTDAGSNYVFLVAAHSCSTGCPYGLSSMQAGKLYALAGNGSYGFSAPNAVSGTSASLSQPQGVTVDGSGDVLFADQYASTIELVAAHNCSSGCPYGLAATQTGYIYDVAKLDSLATPLAALANPSDVTLDAVGDLLVANQGGSQVMMLAGVNCSADCPYGLPSMTSGDPYVIAGSGSYGNAGSGVKASTAALGSPGQLAIGATRLYLVDNGYDVLREVTGAAAELRLAVSGHGAVSGGGSSCSGTCTSVHAGGSRLWLRATPARGWLSAGWIGGGCRGAGSCHARVAGGATVRSVFRTRSQLLHSLRGILHRVRGRRANHRVIARHHGYRLWFNAPGAGRLTVAWRVRQHHHTVLVAVGHTTPAQVGRHTHVWIKLTQAGRRLLAGRAAVRLSATANLRLSKHVSVRTTRKLRV